MATETEKAYLAGLVDGEGHISITVAKQRADGTWYTHVVIVTISNTHLETLRWVREMWHGGTMVVRQQPCQRVPIANLRWSSAAAVAVLRDVQPYMRIKAPAVAIALEFAKTLNGRMHQSRVITEEQWEQRENLRIAIREITRPDQRVERIPFPRQRHERVCAYCRAVFPSVSTSKRRYCTPNCQHKARWQREKAQRTT